MQLEFPHDCPHRDHDGGPCNYQAGGIRQYRRHLVVRHGLGLSTRGRRVSYHQLDTATAERRRYLQANRQGGRAESRRAFRRRHPVARRPPVTDSDGSSSVCSATPSRRRQPRPADYRSTRRRPTTSPKVGRRTTPAFRRATLNYGRQAQCLSSSRRFVQSHRVSGRCIARRRQRSRSWSVTSVCRRRDLYILCYDPCRLLLTRTMSTT